MFTLYSTIAPKLAIAARPRGGDWLEDEVKTWRHLSIGYVVSLLTNDEERELELKRERELCTSMDIGYESFPILDRGVPESRVLFDELVARVAARISEGVFVLIHCRQGIGRAALVAAGVLVAQGRTPSEAWDAVCTARGRPVPDTDEQRRWLEAKDAKAR